MKILIADDLEDKQLALKAVIDENFEDIDVVQTYAFNSTLRKVMSDDIDLILLDMTMPTYEKENIQFSSNSLRTLAGKDLISKLSYRNIEVPIIIVTAFEVFGRHDSIEHINTILDELIEDYPDLVKGGVLFDVQSDSWKSDLVKKIKSIRDV
ncbi:hypothetical protein [Vibrio parahaemolyticus]|uniref:hypothetical protein n=1 Tax=Vibrio parahaemolyticus TaxID=670 RepID=UPI00301C6ABD